MREAAGPSTWEAYGGVGGGGGVTGLDPRRHSGEVGGGALLELTPPRRVLRRKESGPLELVVLLKLELPREARDASGSRVDIPAECGCVAVCELQLLAIGIGFVSVSLRRAVDVREVGENAARAASKVRGRGRRGMDEHGRGGEEAREGGERERDEGRRGLGTSRRV